MEPLLEPSFLGYDSKSPERGCELDSAASERIGPAWLSPPATYGIGQVASFSPSPIPFQTFCRRYETNSGFCQKRGCEMPSEGTDLRDVEQMHPPWSLLLPLQGRSASVQGDRLPVLANLVSGVQDREPWEVLAVRLVRSASIMYYRQALMRSTVKSSVSLGGSDKNKKVVGEMEPRGLSSAQNCKPRALVYLSGTVLLYQTLMAVGRLRGRCLTCILRMQSPPIG
eukprot:bmy_13534T0